MKSNPAPGTDSGDAGGAVPSCKRRRGASGQRLLPAAPVPTVDPVLALIERVARDPSADLDKLQRLLEMRSKVEADARERAFNDALAAAQAEMEPIRADAVNAEVGRAHRYASYAALDRVVRPIYTAHGLAVTFTTGERSTDIAVEVVAYITGHGHGRRYSIVMPADGKGPRGGDVMSRTHAAASAISYGMRYLLIMAFNLAIDRDDDGNAAGRLPATASAQLKREGVWPQFEGEMRAAKSLQALQTVVQKWRPRVASWSQKWRGAAEELHGQCHERLGGTLAALQESAARIETPPSPPVHWED